MEWTRRTVILSLIGTLIVSIPLVIWAPIDDESGKDLLLPILGWFMAKGGDAIAWLINSTEASRQRNAAQDQTLARLGDAVAASVGTGSGGAAQPVIVTNDPANPVPTAEAPKT